MQKIVKKYFKLLEYDVSPFKGSKFLIIENANSFGAKNLFMAVYFIIAGIICFFISGIFIAK